MAKKIVMVAGLIGLLVSIGLNAYELVSGVGKVEILNNSQKILFNDRTSDVITVMNLDGSGKIELSSGTVTCLSVSPNEKKVAYSLQEDELWLINIDGSNREKLSNSKVKQIEWLDNNTLLYTAVDEQKTTINIYNLETRANKTVFEGVSIKKGK
ncbi:MAG: hypothetical protein AB1349_08635 [Elusimicrobiota bacterium]